MSIFREIANAVPIEQVVSRYGTKVNHGKTLCPFHPDKHPSMTFKHNHYRCWSCGAAGSTIDFIMNMFNLTAIEAAKQLNSDFNLGMDLDKPIVPYIAFKYKEERQTEVNFDKWVNNAIKILSVYFIQLNDNARLYAPKQIGSEYHPLYVGALKNHNYIEYILDILTFGEAEEKIEVFKHYRKEVKKIDKENKQIAAPKE